MARGEQWATTAYRALVALSGEADEVQMLRWTQDNRPGLGYKWQADLIMALRENSQGEGKALFEPVMERHGRWRLSGRGHELGQKGTRSTRQTEAPTLGRWVAKAIEDPEGSRNDPLDVYHLAIIAYELEWYAETVKLLDWTLGRDLESPYREKAEQLRGIAALKQDG